MRHVSKPGRLANAAERGAGVIVHAVDSQSSELDRYTPALCGAKPSGRMGWNDYAALSPSTPVPAVNCAKCLAKQTTETA
ncbi:hypothetical protein [Stutzerimonas stutzeri]|uniref:hypothetical protein n=1 Tax=Stutzerimonas stutzeri TaxID=316 RepID=UPI0015E47688|nr:hypothetical protein [Stutzerimonas stutzeri]MBA1280394.1 hypothetical protein [Stutzerimonas stutzeri]